MTRQRPKKSIEVKEVNIDKTATQRGLAGETRAGFIAALDVAAYTIKINGMVNCGNTGCGFRRQNDPRCKTCPQHDADYLIKQLYALKA